MEAWLKVSKGHCESGHYLESNFSVEIFSAEIFSAEIFTAEPSLRNLHCGTLTAEASLRSSSGEIALLGFHKLLITNMLMDLLKVLRPYVSVASVKLLQALSKYSNVSKNYLSLIACFQTYSFVLQAHIFSFTNQSLFFVLKIAHSIWLHMYHICNIILL